MKQIVWKWSLGLALTALPFAGGCLQESPTTPVHSAASQPGAVPNVPLAEATGVADPATVAAAPTNDITTAEVKPVQVEASLPAHVRTAGPAAEMARLANSGVDEGVMLAYVTNSTGYFSLNADEIIYMKDLGVPGAVVTAMIQRDQELKGQMAAGGPANAQGQTQSEPQQPNPGDVAPQPAPNAAVAAPVYSPAPAAPAAEPTYSTFYSSLAPYGTWVEVDGYGRCWRPTVVAADPGWQPYLDNGRWVYTDSGWYWYSDYSWGWAPFHYGRWFRHHNMGWCWAPDVVWGPSWVSWRYSNDYCGWAPLPPAACYRPGFGFSYYGRPAGLGFEFGLGVDCFAFVSWGGFHHDHLRGYAAPRNHITQIYNTTVVVNHFEGNRNTVINRGISPERVSQLSRTEVRKVSIRDAGRETLRAGRGESLDSSRGTLAVYRPKVAAPQRDSATVNNAPAAGSPRRERSGTGVAESRTPATPTRNNLASSAAEQTSRSATSAPEARALDRSGRTRLPQEKSAAPPVSTAPAAPARTGRTGSSHSAVTPSSPIVRSETAPVTPGRSIREPNVGNQSSTTRAPSILHGSQSGAASQRTPAVSSPRFEAPNRQPAPAYRSAAPAASIPPRAQPQPAPVYSAPRFENSQRSQPSYHAESPSISAPMQPRTARSEPTYNAPSYSAPQRSQAFQAPHYSPAPVQAPQYNSGGASSRSFSGGGGGQPSYSAPAQRESRSAPSMPPQGSSPAGNSRPDRRNNS